MGSRTAVITGAAGAIGRAIAGRFIATGIRVCLFDYRADALEQTRAELAHVHGPENVLVHPVDVRNTDEIDAGFEHVLAEFAQVDILVNNAAVTMIKAIDTITDEDIDDIIDTDLKGYIRCARRAVAEMKRVGNGGDILMIASKNGLEGAADKCLYSAAKGGVLTLARSLAKELGPFGIRVNSICPDAVLEGSYIWREGGQYRSDTAKRYGLELGQIPDYYRERSALKRNISAEDVAAAAVFLVSDEARAITGTILPVDGGVAFVR